MAPDASRREFLTLAGMTVAAVGLDAAQNRTEGRLYAYVGRHASGGFAGPAGGGGGLSVFTINMQSGSLTQVSATGAEFDDLMSDSVCVSRDGRFLYTMYLTPAFKQVAGAGGAVAAFAINRGDGSLRHLNTQPSMGANPASVVIDKTNSRLLVGNHGEVAKIVTVTKRNGVPVIESPTDDATVAIFPLKADGSLDPASDVHVFAKRPLSEPGRGAAVHGVIFDRTERWLIATDNGYDHLYVYPFTPTARTLVGKSFPTPAGKAPRHLVAHPRASYFFITNEREASVSSFHFDSDTGEVRAVQTAATLPPGYAGPNVAPSNIRMHPNGTFLYAANRGDDSIATFSIDESNGRVAFIETVKTGGRGPREMNIEPSGRFFFVCNLQSNQVVTFAIDASTGKLTQVATLEVQRPACIDFASIQ